MISASSNVVARRWVSSGCHCRCMVPRRGLMSPNKLWYYSVKKFITRVWPDIIKGMSTIVTSTLLRCNYLIWLNKYHNLNLVRSMLSVYSLVCEPTVSPFETWKFGYQWVLGYNKVFWASKTKHTWLIDDIKMVTIFYNLGVASPLRMLCRIYWTFQQLRTQRRLWCKSIEIKFGHYWIMKVNWMC